MEFDQFNERDNFHEIKKITALSSLEWFSFNSAALLI